LAEQLQISETIGQRTVDTEIVRNVGIPSSLPPAERVVSVNARVEITEATARSGSVVYSGIIRSSIFYASADDPSNVVSINRTFNFTEQVVISNSRPGMDVNIDASISDIDFYLINDRLIGVEYTVTSDIEVSSPERVQFIRERPDIELQRQQFRISREIEEKTFNRTLSSVERIPSESPDIRRVISIDSDIQIIDIEAGYDRIIIRGIVNNDILYVNTNGQVEYLAIRFAFDENFIFRGVTPDMSPFVEAIVLEEKSSRVNSRQLQIDVKVAFKILVVKEEIVSVPTAIISPENIFPVRRTVIVERIVARERTRIMARENVNIPEGNPDVYRVIRVNGRLVGGSLNVEVGSGGVLISGTVEANIIYVADLPTQAVYYTSDRVQFNYFLEIPEVTSNMNAIADVTVIESRGSKVSDRVIRVSIVLEVNLIVTERVRVPIVVDVSPTLVEEEPIAGEGFIRYTIRSGDTLYLISRRYGVSLNRLVEINNITNPDRLEVGVTILIPRA
jgi:hypothetical protein